MTLGRPIMYFFVGDSHIGVFSFHTPLRFARPHVELHYHFGEAYFAVHVLLSTLVCMFMFTYSTFDVSKCIRVAYVLAVTPVLLRSKG